jgi:hypothetical protein
MNIEIPDLPSQFNPSKWKVKVSSIGEEKSGEWPFVLSVNGHWIQSITLCDSREYISACLIEPKYWLAGEMKSETECRAILERDYEPAINGVLCRDCPFGRDATCTAGGSVFHCSNGAQWRKKQSVVEWVEPTDEDAKKRPQVQVRNSDKDSWSPITVTLIAVKEKTLSNRFVTLAKDGTGIASWERCRMKKSASLNVH